MNRKFFFLALLISASFDAAAKSKTSPAEALTAICVFLVVAVLAFVFSAMKTAKPDEIAKTATQFQNGTEYQLDFYRQSGNHHRSIIVDGSQVMREIESTFNRAKIFNTYGIKNENGVWDFFRTSYNGTGGSEGKRIGGCLVRAMIK